MISWSDQCGVHTLSIFLRVRIAWDRMVLRLDRHWVTSRSTKLIRKCLFRKKEGASATVAVNGLGCLSKRWECVTKIKLWSKHAQKRVRQLEEGLTQLWSKRKVELNESRNWKDNFEKSENSKQCWQASTLTWILQWSQYRHHIQDSVQQRSDRSDHC